MTYKAHIFGKFCLTWCRQGSGAPFIDKCMTKDKEGHNYKGYAILLRPWRKNSFNEPALVLAWKEGK